MMDDSAFLVVDTDPSDDFVRFILGQSEIDGKIGKMTQRILDTNRDILRTAMEAFVVEEGLARFGYAPKDVVRSAPELQDAAPAPAVAAEPEMEVVPSEREFEVLNYIKNRLFFLVRVRRSFMRRRLFCGPLSAGNRGVEGRRSFLKKRTKKLLLR